jgi:DNA polymerase-3 subunit delta'
VPSAEKARPAAKLGEIIGHAPWRRYFEGALADRRLAHAYLFVGPPKVGKWTFARALAKRLACAAPSGGDACGACGPCRRVEAGTHPDISAIDAVAEGERGLSVEIVRERILEAFRLRPHEAPMRVVVVNDADRMEPGAQNALLKTLEEPPPRSILFLVTSSTSALLETVVSRCFVLRFAPVAEEELALGLERRGVASSEARQLAAHAEGFPGRAIEWTGGGSPLATLARDLLARRVAPPDASKTLAAVAETYPEKSAFERRRQSSLSLCLWLAAEARNQQMVDSQDVTLQLLLDRAAETAAALQANATPELAMDRFFIALSNELLDPRRD